MFVLVACGRGVDCIKADLSGVGSLGEDTPQHAGRERSVFGSLSGQEKEPLHQTRLMESPVPVNTRYHLSGPSEEDEKVQEA